jgi:fermentation-respiration switch protein FrsA (DUF1100 family)
VHRRSRIALLAFAATFLLLLVAAFALQRQAVFPRFAIWPLSPIDPAALGAEVLRIDTPDGPVPAWFLPGAGVSADRPGPVVVFAHGNAERIEHWATRLAGYRERGYSLLLPEYRGYGDAPGTPSQDAITDDFVRFVDLVAVRPDVDPKRVVLHGRSIGGGVACSVARLRPPAALILQSTFSSMLAMARRYWLPWFPLLDTFDNAGTVAAYPGPVLIIHGRDDSMIPFAHAEALAAASPRARLVGYPGDHNDTPRDEALYWRDLEAFLRDALP